MSRILVVEDERHLADGLRYNLEAERYEVRVVDNGEEALVQLDTEPTRYDLIILDVMLPGIDGFGVVAALRRKRQFVPVLMLTARGRSEDVLRGFDSGADDYLPKPFELPILLSRVHGLLRRTVWFREAATLRPSAGATPYSFPGRTIDFEQLEVRTGGNRMSLTPMEAALLRYLTRHEGTPVSREAILEAVWGLRDDTDTRAIDNFIVRLRRYIEDDPTKPRHLQTIRGVGYRFVANPTQRPTRLPFVAPAREQHIVGGRPLTPTGFMRSARHTVIRKNAIRAKVAEDLGPFSRGRRPWTPIPSDRRRPPP